MRIFIALLLFCNCRSTEGPVTRALLFLARHQREDGSWGDREKGCRCRPRISIDTPVRMPIDPALKTRYERLLDRLGADGAEARDRAQRELQGLGAGAVPLLQESLDHPDPEVALRCREALRKIWETDGAVRTLGLSLEWAPEEGCDVLTTGLALLCFLGAGYSHFSKDEFPVPGERVYAYGTVVRKAASWLESKQGPDGSFDSRTPLAHAIAAAAMSELYGITGAKAYVDSAAKAIVHLKTMKSSEPTFLIWKGIALHSAHLSELPDCAGSACDQMKDLLDQEGSRASLSAARLLSKCERRGTETLRTQFSELDLEGLSPFEEWVATAAILRFSDDGFRKRWQEAILPHLRDSQERAPGCDAGSWRSIGRSWQGNLITTLYTTLTMERTYRYSCALFNTTLESK